MGIEEFYLKDHDFQIFINKGCQTYGRTPEEMFQLATVREVYLSMQKGGINGKQNNRGADNGCADKAGTEGA
jgi:hypothetical protein